MAITTIGTNIITDANITSAKVADDAITAAKLSDTFGMVLLNTTTVSSSVANVTFSSSLTGTIVNGKISVLDNQLVTDSTSVEKITFDR